MVRPSGVVRVLRRGRPERHDGPCRDVPGVYPAEGRPASLDLHGCARGDVGPGRVGVLPGVPGSHEASVFVFVGFERLRRRRRSGGMGGLAVFGIKANGLPCMREAVRF